MFPSFLFDVVSVSITVFARKFLRALAFYPGLTFRLILSCRWRDLSMSFGQVRVVLSGYSPTFIVSFVVTLACRGTLYLYYSFRLGDFNKKKHELTAKQIYFLYREDIRYMRRLSEETRLLEKKIDTSEQLTTHMAELNKQITMLTAQRQQLRNKSRNIKDDEKLAVAKTEISELSKSLRVLHREVWLCKDVQQRSGVIADKIRQERADIHSKKFNLSVQNKKSINR